MWEIARAMEWKKRTRKVGRPRQMGKHENFWGGRRVEGTVRGVRSLRRRGWSAALAGAYGMRDRSMRAVSLAMNGWSRVGILGSAGACQANLQLGRLEKGNSYLMNTDNCTYAFFVPRSFTLPHAFESNQTPGRSSI